MRRYIVRGAACAVAIAGITAVSTEVSEAATDTANANASIVAAIAISKTVDLEFASVVAAGSADTVVVSAAGARTCGSNLTCTGSVAAASFDVTGGANLTYAITLPASTTISSGGNNMTVDTFTSLPSTTGTLDGSGAENSDRRRNASSWRQPSTGCLHGHFRRYGRL